MAYCDVGDLVLGSIPLPAYLDPAQKVQDAADEIDSRIGGLYQTPINVATGSPVSRPARLFLKRVNAHLASGRILMAIAAPEENRNLHAYAYQLVKDSLSALDAIVAGEAVLDGAPVIAGSAVPAATVPLISNLDSESNVEAFYNRVANPNYSYGPLYRPESDRLLW